jgi:hypothetical protein
MTPVFDVDPEDEDGKVTLPPSRRQPDRPLEGEEAAAHIAGLVDPGILEPEPDDPDQLADDLELLGELAQERADELYDAAARHVGRVLAPAEEAILGATAKAAAAMLPEPVPADALEDLKVPAPPPDEGMTRYLVQRFHSATMLDGEMFEVWIDLGTLDAPSRDEALATLRGEAWARFMPAAGASTAFRIVAARALGRSLPVEGRAMVVPIWGGETP